MRVVITPQTAAVFDDVRLVANCTTPSFSRAFFNGGKLDVGLLPPAVRWISDDGLAMIVERPPQFHRVTLNTYLYNADGSSRTQESDHNIPVPWTIWGLKFWDQNLEGVEVMHLLTRPGPIATVEDPLFRAQYPNIFAEDDKICGVPYLANTVFQSITDAINDCINGFWGGTFNQDLSGSIAHHLNKHGSIAGYFRHLETRDIDQVIEEIGPQSVPNGTVQDLINRLRQTGETAPTTTVGFLQQLITRSSVES